MTLLSITILTKTNCYSQLGTVKDTRLVYLKIWWTYDPPPDFKRYLIKCSDESVVYVTPYNVIEYEKNKYYWCGDINADIYDNDKVYCYVEAEDLAGQLSGWAGPAIKDVHYSVIINNIN